VSLSAALYPVTDTMTALEEISTDELVREIQRRLECQNKPDKRLILIGPPGCGKVRPCDRQLSLKPQKVRFGTQATDDTSRRRM
jgi:hypothetical protein